MRWSSSCPSPNVRSLLYVFNIPFILSAAFNEWNLDVFSFRVSEGQQELPESKHSGFGAGEGLRVPDDAERSRLPSRRGWAGGGHRPVEHGDAKAEQEASHSCCADSRRTGQNECSVHNSWRSLCCHSNECSRSSKYEPAVIIKLFS